MIKQVKTKLGDIEYSIVGKGTPILFIHGGHSNCRETLCCKGLDQEMFQLITPSRPGYGKTPLANNKTARQAADLFIELLNELKIDKVVVYGISAGGLTAIELAGNYPDRVSKLVLASAISKEWLDKQGKIYKTAQRLFHPKMEKFTWGMVHFFSKLMPGMMAKSFYSQFSSLPAHKLNKVDVKDLVDTLKVYSSGTGFINDIDQNIDEDVLKKITCPTLIIHSKNDVSVSIDHPEHAHTMIASSVLEIIDNEWGHMLWLGKDSGKAIGVITKFIS